MRTKIDSPYTASVTGGGFLFTETGILLPLLQSEDRAQRLKDEAVNNNLQELCQMRRARSAFLPFRHTFP